MLLVNKYFFLIIICRIYISKSLNIYYLLKYRLNNENYILNAFSRSFKYNPIITSKISYYFFQFLIINRNEYQTNTDLNENGVYIKCRISENINNIEICIRYKCIEGNKFYSFLYFLYMKKNIKYSFNDIGKLYNSIFINYKYIGKDTFNKIYSFNKNEKIYDKEFSISSKRIINDNKKILINKYKYLTLVNDKIYLKNNYQISYKNYKSYKKIKLLFDSEIILTIKGNNTQQILNNKEVGIKSRYDNEIEYYIFNTAPSEILINGNKTDIIDFYVYNLILEENNITIRFNNTLTNCNVMFYGLSNITTIIFKNFNFSKVTSMKGIFHGCSNLISLDLSISNAQSLTDISYMFYGCSNLIYLDLTKMNLSSITYMKSMFFGCSNIISLDLNTFDTSSVFDMSYIFDSCSNLITLYLNNWRTSSLLYMGFMFYNCINLISLDLTNFDTSSVIYMNKMFYNCINLIYLDLTNFDSSSILLMQGIEGMFKNCNSNLIYCIKNINSKNKQFITQIENDISQNIINDCSNICFNNNKKIIYDDRICSLNCTDTDKYNFKNICYKKCPTNTYLMFENNCVTNCINGYYIDKDDSSIKICKCINPKCLECSLESLANDLCISCNDDYYPIYNDPSNIYPYINCYKSAPEGYYFDSIVKNYKLCYPSCQSCKEKGDKKDNKCLKCALNYQFKNDFPNDTNCYEKCEYNYYFDSEKNYFCVSQCPEKYNKIIEEKKKMYR